MKAVKLTLKLLLLLMLALQLLLPFFITTKATAKDTSWLSRPYSTVITIDVCSVKGKLLNAFLIMLPQGIFFLITTLVLLFYLPTIKPFTPLISIKDIFHPPTLL